MGTTAQTNSGKIVQGALQGFAATAPMTAAMVLMHRLLPPQQRHALPPRHITDNVAESVGVKRHLTEKERQAATLVAHFGYGAVMGTIYELLAPKIPGPRLASGIVWGLLVWAGSYLGALPAADLHESAVDHPKERNILMILAHVVWGATLGFLSGTTKQISRQTIARRLPQRDARGRFVRA